MNKIKIIFFLFLTPSLAQDQMVLLKNEQVIFRNQIGDKIQFILKGERKSREEFIQNFWEFGIITTQDSISFSSIKRIHSGSQSTFLSRLGSLLIIGGAGYFFIDQFNQGVLAGNNFSFEEEVWKPSLTLMALGGILKITRKRWYGPGVGAYRLMTAEPDSPFYLSLD